MRKLQRFEPTWFFPNYACQVSNELAIVLVRGCASGFVRRVAYAAREGSWVRKTREIEILVGHHPDPSLLRPVERRDGVHTVALWRDPVQRWAAVYAQWCIDKEFNPYAARLGLHSDHSWERFFEFTQWELGKGDPLSMVEHVRPQSAIWNRDVVDEVVPVERVRQLLSHHGIGYRYFAAPIRPNVTLPPNNIVAAIRELYAEDYQLSGFVGSH